MIGQSTCISILNIIGDQKADNKLLFIKHVLFGKPHAIVNCKLE